MGAIEEAIALYGIPAIINSDQGSQFTSDEYIRFLAQNGIRQSMDGKARWVDNVIIERWFRSLKCECIYINHLKFLRPHLRSNIFCLDNGDTLLSKTRSTVKSKKAETWNTPNKIIVDLGQEIYLYKNLGVIQ